MMDFMEPRLLATVRTRPTLRVLAGLAFLLVLATGTVAGAFQGPYASIVTGSGGFALDLDVRWPDGPPPAGGWPVVFWGHGAGGDKTTSTFATQRYSNDGYVARRTDGGLPSLADHGHTAVLVASGVTAHTVRVCASATVSPGASK